MIYTVNGEEVDYIQIDNTDNTLTINYQEKFDIVTADISHIEKKLHDKEIQATVCKDLYNMYIGIFLEELEDYIGIVHILELPFNSYEIDRENNFMIVLINKLPKYRDKTYKDLI